jgi:hypothetical protein
VSAVDELLASVITNGDGVDPAVAGPIVRNGRYLHTHPVTGELMRSTRASNFARLLADTFRLQQWERRKVLLGASMRPDITARAIAAGAEDDKALDKLVSEAKEVAGGNAGANLGTAMHDLTDRLDRGQDVPAPAPLDADLRAYRETLDHHHVRIRRDLIERHVCLPDLGVAGRFDRIVDWRPAQLDERLVVADLKTGAYLAGLEIAVQLALYARAEWMWEPGIGWVPKPPTDLTEALVVHLPAGQAECHLYVVDIAAGWEAVQEADRVRDWRRRSKGLLRALDIAGSDDLAALLSSSLTPTAPSIEDVFDMAAPLASTPADLASRARTQDHDRAAVAAANSGLRARLGVALKALGDELPLGIAWPTDVPKFREGGPTTWPQVKAVEAFVWELEKETQAPFADMLPDDPSAIISEPAVVALAAVNTPPARTPATELDALKARFAAIAPEDIRAAATTMARENGLADVEHLDATQLVALEEIITAAESDYEKRKGYLASRLQPWDDAEVECFRAACASGRPLDAFAVDDVERLDAVLAAFDSGALRLQYVESLAVLEVPPATEARLAIRYGGKGALRDAAVIAAQLHGRSKPRSAAQVIADPVLVALLAVGTDEAAS